MPTERHLGNAPIAEALLDIRVQAAQDFDPTSFLNLEEELRAYFPNKEERRLKRLHVEMGPSKSPAVENLDLGLQGLFFKSADERVIAQFRVDGFTVNRLAPYKNWEELYSYAQRYWPLYVRVAQPVAITRLALRYVNRLPVPSTRSDLGSFMRVPVSIPSELPQTVSDFFCRFTINDLERQVSAHITQSFEVRGPEATWLLDIDAFQESQWEPTDPRIYDVFGHLHDFKNQLFFNLLTEEAIRGLE